MQIEWDQQKADMNLRRHRVSFAEAATVFLDPLSGTGDDPDHSLDERRFLTFGLATSGELFAVAHAERRGSPRYASGEEDL